MSEQPSNKPGASIAAGSVKAAAKDKATTGEGEEETIPDMSLLSITDGENERGIPVVKFIDDVGAFTQSFTPPASAELLIGAYTELHSKFKTYEISLTQKRTFVCVVCYFNCTSLVVVVVDDDDAAAGPATVTNRLRFP